jgi:hypothetical protein
VVHPLKVSLEDLYNGTSKKLSLVSSASSAMGGSSVSIGMPYVVHIRFQYLIILFYNPAVWVQNLEIY